MRSGNFRRLNITLPESTVAMLDSIADKGSRSSFIDEAIKERAKKLRQREVRKLLRESAILNRERDSSMAEEWFHLEEELWRD
jgi:metal-responsive CopG/Arc/MetJ family transcriptional regulator